MSCVQEQPTGDPRSRLREKEFLRQLRIVLAEVDKTGVGKLRRLETGAANRGLPPLFGAKPSPDRASFMDSVAGLLGVAGGELLITTLLFMYGADIRTAGTASLMISLVTVANAISDRRAVLVRGIGRLGGGTCPVPIHDGPEPVTHRRGMASPTRCSTAEQLLDDAGIVPGASSETTFNE